ncbi:MAG: hypothetical protein HY909_26840 [Deltaproteobacteria bacterium]|nr:hypothetical protein [Deltaproteobacteria bacterium]
MKRLGRALALLAALQGCPGEAPAGDASVDATPFESVLVQGSDARAQPLGVSTPLRIFLGFQGFRYAQVRLETRETPPSLARAVGRLAIEGYDPVEQPIGRVAFHRVGDLWRSDVLMLFVNDVPLNTITGRGYTLSLDAWDASRRTRADARGVVTHDPSCIAGVASSCEDTP